MEPKPKNKKIIPIGNRNGIVLPANWLDDLGWDVGDQVALKEDNGRIIIEKIENEK